VYDLASEHSALSRSQKKNSARDPY